MEEIKGKMNGTNMTHFIESRSAASTAIAAILLLGILFSVISIITLGYVPEWKNDAEYSHISEVWEDMMTLKAKIDKETINLVSDQDSLTPNITINVPLHVGGSGILFLRPMKNSETFSINTDRCKMVIVPENQSAQVINCGTVTYRSNNRYYVDQTYSYENGALILAQNKKSIIKLYPSFRVSRVTPGNYSISINAVEVRGPASTLSLNSEGSIHLQDFTFISLHDSDNYGNVTSFMSTIYTEHPEAWELYLNETMTEKGLEKDKDYTLEPIENGLYFSFPMEGSTNHLKRLYISKTVVNAKLGIGLG